MSEASKAMKKQEIRVLASKKFVIRRRVVNITDTNANKIIAEPVEGVLSATLNRDLGFVSGNNLPANLRYGFIIKFGHLADQFLTITADYNPLSQTKMHYWYTDE